MSVEFSRLALIEAAQTVIAAHEDSQAEWDRRVQQYKADHLAKWKSKHLPGVKAFRDWLTAQLRNSTGGISSDSAPSFTLYSEPAEYVIQREVEKPPGHGGGSVQEARLLLSMLEASTSETITANELRILGFSKLAVVYTAVAEAQARS